MSWFCFVCSWLQLLPVHLMCTSWLHWLRLAISLIFVSQCAHVVDGLGLSSVSAGSGDPLQVPHFHTSMNFVLFRWWRLIFAFVLESSLEVCALDSIVYFWRSVCICHISPILCAFVAYEGVIFQRFSCLVPAEPTADSFDVVRCSARLALEVTVLYPFLAAPADRSWVGVDISGPSDLHCVVVAWLSNTLGLMYSPKQKPDPGINGCSDGGLCPSSGPIGSVPTGVGFRLFCPFPLRNLSGSTPTLRWSWRIVGALLML